MFRSLQHEHVYTIEPFPRMSEVLYISALSYDLQTLQRNSGNRDAFDSITTRQLILPMTVKWGKKWRQASVGTHTEKRGRNCTSIYYWNSKI